MPVDPTQWVLNQPVSAKKLNTDLYTYTPGNANTPNGVLFHAQKPMWYEYVQECGASQVQGSSVAGTFGPISTAGISTVAATWAEVWDSAAYYGAGADAPGNLALGHFIGATLGANGLPEVAPTASGGWYMIGGNIAWAAATTAPATNGVGVSVNQVTSANPLLANQLSSTLHDNCAFGLDLLNPNNSSNYALGGYASGSATSQAYHTVGAVLASDWTGETTRQFSWWTNVNPANGSKASVPPVPPSLATSLTTMTSAGLNSTIVNTLNFLNMPPVLRASNGLTTSIASGSNVSVPLNGTAFGAQLDTFGGLASGVYTVPTDGVYLVHGAVSWVADSSSSYNRQTGVKVGLTGGGTLQLLGPAYQTASTANAGSGTISTITRLLDLKQGDTLTLTAGHNKGSATNLSSTNPTRLIVQWMSALGTPSTLWQNPDPGYRWQAGTPGSQLPALFNQYTVNDLNFLINKPYLLSSQTSAQTGLTAGPTSTNLTNMSATGPVHASVGDNYSGFASNKYTAVRAGWYLVVEELTTATSTSTPYNPCAQVFVAGTGLFQQASDGTSWGQHVATTSGSMNPGATYVNIHYLRVGDSIQPAGFVNLATGNWGTAVPAGQASSFGLVWMGQ